jgi:alkanesulfonate monooxygenase SsuD/methylene tetrahydromethanopterin reductase-like flavin-dependent oxidoreductase (luciferase family)
MWGNSDAAPLLEMAERAEAAGFDSVWAGESVVARPRFDAYTLLAAAAARTRRVTLGTAVVLPAIRHPVAFAQTAASLDRLSGGRLVLGVGYGFKNDATRREYESTGAEFEHRVTGLRELIAICRALWRGERVTRPAGRWPLHDVELFPRPQQAGGPPIWMGGSGPLSLKITGELADGWLPNSVTPAEFRGNWQQATQIARAAGRDPAALTAAWYATLNVQDSRQAAQRELEHFVEQYYQLPYAAIAARQGGFAGTPGEAVDYLQGFAAAGVQHLVIRLGGVDTGALFQRVAEEVLPKLR